ncbi:hypothetical protein C0991_008234, partial [Blastosporella zonata]
MRFPTRTVSKASEEHDGRYTRSEEQRKDIFQASLYEFQREFREEEEAQSLGEHSRRKEFDTAMTNFKGIFLQGLAHRNELYKEADTHHEDTFSKANAEREAVFSQGQQGRADAFKYDQEARAKSSEWNSTARRTLLQKGHRRLEDTCTAIEAAL